MTNSKHFHGTQHIRGGITLDPETIEPNAMYWYNSANTALVRLQDVVGDEEGRRMTQNIDGTWKDIYKAITILADLAQEQKRLRETITPEAQELYFDFAGVLNEGSDTSLNQQLRDAGYGSGGPM